MNKHEELHEAKAEEALIILARGDTTVIGVNHPEFRAKSPKDWALKASIAAMAGDKASQDAIRHRLQRKLAEPSDFPPQVRASL
jgi:hypothetical protein